MASKRWIKHLEDRVVKHMGQYQLDDLKSRSLSEERYINALHQWIAAYCSN